MSQITFIGLKPPDLDVPVIDLEGIDGGVVDLHNECDLDSVVFKGSQLAFAFLTCRGRNSVRVLFGGVRGLRVEQPPDWAEEEADQIDHLLIRRDGPWPRVNFKAGGLSYEFDAAELILVTARTDSWTPPSP